MLNSPTPLPCSVRILQIYLTLDLSIVIGYFDLSSYKHFVAILEKLLYKILLIYTYKSLISYTGHCCVKMLQKVIR